VTVLSCDPFDDHPIHVLEVRGRAAFIPCELAIAAGYREGGRRFLDEIFNDWAAGLEEDDDLAQLTPTELAAVKRDLPGMSDTKLAVVLFASGAMRCLRRSRARRSQDLLEFLRTTLLPRFEALIPVTQAMPAGSAPSNALAKAIGGEQAPARSTALREAFAQLKRLGVKLHKVSDRKEEYREILHLAEGLREDHVVTHEEWGALRVEAIEHLLGRPLRTRLALADLFVPIPTPHA
jgi:hypothetical protein